MSVPNGGALLTIIAMRHAQAVPSDRNGDRERALTDAGKRAARSMFKQLEERRLVADVAFVSPAKRTRQTVEQCSWEELRVEFVEELYNASAETIDSVVRTAAAAQTILVIAHNPGISAYADAGVVLRPADAVVLTAGRPSVHMTASR